MIKRILKLILLIITLMSILLANDVYSKEDIAKGKPLTNITAKLKPEPYNETYGICENEQIFVPLFFDNKGGSESYQLSIEGVNWAYLNVNNFFIPSKKSAAVLVKLSPPEKSEGMYKIIVNSLSSAGTKNSAVLDVNVSKCYGIGLEIDKTKDRLCSGDFAEYKAIVLNKGKFAEDIGFDISVNWINASAVISLGANEKQDVRFYARPIEKGEFTAIITAFLKKKPEVKSEKSIEIGVLPKYECYKGEILANENIRNAYSEEFMSFRVKNAGERYAKYKISIEAPDWISVEPNDVALNPGQIWNANLHINPNPDLEEGKYKAIVKLQYEDVEYPKEIIVEVKKSIFPSLLRFYRFYKYYIYIFFIFLFILFMLRKRIYRSYKKYKIKRVRIKALKKARLARLAKKERKGKI